MVRRELKHWKRVLLEWPLCALLLLALLAGLAAYQARRPQAVDVGGIHDAPYLRAFHDPEAAPAQGQTAPPTFRWTRGRVGLEFVGIGRQPVEVRLRMQSARPPGVPAAQAGLWAEGRALFTATVGPQWQVYRALLPAGLLASGDLRLELRSETFLPAADPRDLGVSVDWVEVRPAGLGWIEPAWTQVGCLVGTALLSYLLLRRCGLGRWWTAALVALTALLLACLLAWHRLSLTYFSVPLVVLLAGGLLLTAVALPLLERWPPRFLHGRWAGREMRFLWTILLLGLLLRLGGMLYPQFRSSDIMLHVHNAEGVRVGDLLFTELLPDVNLPAPYPPGLYVALLPGSLLVGDLTLLLEVGGVVLDALAGLLLYLLARRLSGRRDVAALALLLQQLAPVTFYIFSWGNYANMFSRLTLLAALVLLALPDWRRAGLRQWAGLLAAFVLVLLSHFADSLLFGGLVLAAVALGLLGSETRRAALGVLGVLFLAGALVLGLYYAAPTIWGSLGGLVETFLGGQGRPAVLVNPLTNFLRDVQAPVALLALPGLALVPRARGRWAAVVLGAALLVAVAFALGQAFLGFSSRYSFFVLPVLALGAGALLAALRGRGWAGRLAVALLLGAMAWNCLYTWWWLIGFGQR